MFIKYTQLKCMNVILLEIVDYLVLLSIYYLVVLLTTSINYLYTPFSLFFFNGIFMLRL